jgi:glucose/arabinose dehydrogenase
MSGMKTLMAAAVGAALIAGPSATAQTPLTTELVVSGMARPVFATHAPGDATRLFILEQHVGNVRIFDFNAGQLLPTPFLTIPALPAGNEQGLLGLAFHPDYNSNGFFYIYFTEDDGATGTTRVVRYTVSVSDPNVADPASARPIVSVPQNARNHNGGWLEFGPDGHLYIALGDGGGGGDPGNRAQTITNQLLGKMLRIDPDGDDFPGDPTRNYAIPPSNPFVGITGDDEIWAYGLRNPYRASFDRLTGDVYIGDVGQNQWEEINFQPANSTGGENYGWRCYEASAPFNLTGCADPSTMVFPIHEYPISNQPECAVIGGYVYRGRAISDLRGTYFFGDHCSRRVWSFRFDGANVTEFQDRTAELPLPDRIYSFGEDALGEIYITLRNGQVRRIIPDGPVCYPDCDADGQLDFFDFLCFQNAFLGGEPYADCDMNGKLDFFDFLCFQNEFLAGCP